MNISKKYFLRILVIWMFILLVVPMMGVNAQADLGGEIRGNLNTVQSNSGLPQNEVGGLPGLIGNVIKAALTFVGTIFLVITIYGGFLWMTAGGSSDRVQKAGSLLRNGVIGLIIIFVSYAITFFVFDMLLAATK